MKFEQNRIENIDFFFLRKLTLGKWVSLFFFFLLLVFELRLIQLLFHVCPSSQLPFISSFKEYCHGWERSEIGEDGEMGLWKEEYTRGTRSSSVSDWVVFLVDFSSELFASIRPNCLPRVFIWWAWTSLLEDTGVRVGEELIEKK